MSCKPDNVKILFCQLPEGYFWSPFVTIYVVKISQDKHADNSKQSVQKSLDRICGNSINKYKNIKKTNCVFNYPPLGV